MKSTLLLLITASILIISCKPNRTPVDNPSMVDTTPKFEKAETNQQNLLIKNGTLTKAGKAAEADAGQHQLVDFMYDYANRRHSINEYNDKPKVLSFWASWCGPCYKEKPIFREMEKKYPGIHFISISIDKTLSEAQTFYDNRQIKISPHDYWIGDSDRNRLKWYTLRPVDDGTGRSATVALPTYVLIDADKKTVNKNLPFPSTGQMDKYLIPYNNQSLNR